MLPMISIAALCCQADEFFPRLLDEGRIVALRPRLKIEVDRVEGASLAGHGYAFLLDNGNVSSTHKFSGPYLTVTRRVSSALVGLSLKAAFSFARSPSPLTMRPCVRFIRSV